jgi:hypothetical protein
MDTIQYACTMRGADAAGGARCPPVGPAFSACAARTSVYLIFDS